MLLPKSSKHLSIMHDMHSDGNALFLPSSPSFYERLNPGQASKYNEYHDCHTPFSFYHHQQMLRNRALLHTSMMDMETLHTTSMAPLPTPYRLSTEFHPSHFLYDQESHITTPESDNSRLYDTSHSDSPTISEEMEHLNLTTLSTHNTLEPTMTLGQYGSFPFDRNHEMDISPINYGYGSSMIDYTSSPHYSTSFLEQYLVSDDETSPTTNETTLHSPACRATSEDDDSMDKPYARLIHEALMQAPGHRMMLKEIYEWFIQNTNKPQESGSNGWQNSIRHNLSMNQAFENDKSICPSTRGQSRKANSVWILTDDAIRNGVQSTTRYRKTCSTKKGLSGRLPAAHRQRSGARGGRAARRSAARLRRQEKVPESGQVYSSDTSTGTACRNLSLNLDSTSIDEEVLRQALQREYVVTPPAGESDFKPLYALPTTSPIYHSAQPFKIEHEDVFGPDSYMHDYFYHAGSLANIDEGSKFDAE